jgi:hypothetical protein
VTSQRVGFRLACGVRGSSLFGHPAPSTSICKPFLLISSSSSAWLPRISCPKGPKSRARGPTGYFPNATPRQWQAKLRPLHCPKNHKDLFELPLPPLLLISPFTALFIHQNFFLIAVQKLIPRSEAHVSLYLALQELSLSLTSTSNRLHFASKLFRSSHYSPLCGASLSTSHLLPPLNTTHPQECLKSASDLRSSPHQLSARTWPEP